MKNLTYLERIAIMRVLLDIILADNIVDKREAILYDKIAKKMDVVDAKQDIEKQNSLLALSILRDLPQKVKEEFAKLMGQMIVADEDINYNEVKIYNVVSEFCKIKTEFNIHDYPNFTRS